MKGKILTPDQFKKYFHLEAPTGEFMTLEGDNETPMPYLAKNAFYDALLAFTSLKQAQKFAEQKYSCRKLSDDWLVNSSSHIRLKAVQNSQEYYDRISQTFTPKNFLILEKDYFDGLPPIIEAYPLIHIETAKELGSFGMEWLQARKHLLKVNDIEQLQHDIYKLFGSFRWALISFFYTKGIDIMGDGGRI